MQKTTIPAVQRNPRSSERRSNSRPQLLGLAVISLFVTFSPAAQGAISITNAVAQYPQTITITGEGFNPSSGLMRATLNNMQLDITSSNATTIQANLPNNIVPGSYHLTVTALVIVSYNDPGFTAELDVTLGVDENRGNGNTAAEGVSALFSNTGGSNNTATGFEALYSNTIGSFNTANGFRALFSNTIGNFNTANGFQALNNNITGSYNTANGDGALFSNITGSYNTANGNGALFSNKTGSNNTANGPEALFSNTTGSDNTALGTDALYHNETGGSNTAIGEEALWGNGPGVGNTAIGNEAMYLAGGNKNTAIGFGAGYSIGGGSNNIALGVYAGDFGGNYNISIGDFDPEGTSSSGTIRIGHPALQTNTYIAGIFGVTVPPGCPVVIDGSGHLGTVCSSQRFKQAIGSMDKASEAILSLRPVTFQYKLELDPKGIPQFGLVAEEVEKVNPDLVVRDADGKVYSVRYDAVNAMLLNEFLKQHRKVEEQEATITQVKSTVAKQEATIRQQQKDFQSTAAQQQKEIKALTASLKEQASQIQKVSAQLEVSKPAPQTVADNQ